MQSEQQINLAVNKDLKEDEILITQFEQVKFESLPLPLKLVKDAPNPEKSEKSEEKRRKYYKKAITDAPFLLTAGEIQLNAPQIDPRTGDTVTSKAEIDLRSRRVKDEEKYALLQIEDDGSAVLNILDETWIFSKKVFSDKPTLTNIGESKEAGSKKKQRMLPGENSEEEQNSHMSEKFDDDDDDFNKEDAESGSDKSSEEEHKSRKRVIETQKPAAKRELKDRIVSKMNENGDEMYLDDLTKFFNPDNVKEMEKKLVDLFTQLLDVKEDAGGQKVVTLKKEQPKKKGKRAMEKKSEKKSVTK